MAKDSFPSRIGELLKELELTEGRGTGFPKIERAMQRNGSPPAVFSTDDIRSHFLVTLPIHPKIRGVEGNLEHGEDLIPSGNWPEQRVKAVGHELTTRQREILQVLTSQKEVALRTLLDKLPGHPAPRTIQSELRILSELGLIFSTGKGRSVVWSIQNR